MLYLYKGLKFLFRHILPEWSRYPLARFLGRVSVWVNPARRHTIIGNLTPLVGEKDAPRRAPELMGHFGMMAVDFFCPRRDMVPSVHFDWSLIDKAYRRHKKVILVTAHIGNWEIGISCLVERGYAVAGVYAPYRKDAIVRWIMAHRDSEVEWIPAARGAAEACIAALGKGRVLGMVADIPFGEKGQRVTIAGQKAHLPLGPWAIALRAEAVVIPVFILRQTPGAYLAHVCSPIVPPQEKSYRQRLQTMQESYRHELEKMLMSHPTQWGVLQPFWDHL